MSARYLYFMRWVGNLNTSRRYLNCRPLGTLFAPEACKRNRAGLATTLREATIPAFVRIGT